MDIEVRRADESLRDGIFDCLRAYRFHLLGEEMRADPDFPEEAILSVRNAICSINLEEKCWVATRGTKVLGFCCWDWRDVALRSAKTVLITVVPEARSLGIGSLLQRRRLEEMGEQGAVDVHTWSDDPKAIRWYQERFGYQLLGYEPIYHCLHRFTLGQQTFWGIHRGFVESEQLAHLMLTF